MSVVSCKPQIFSGQVKDGCLAMCGWTTISIRFPCKDLESSNWYNHFLTIVWNTRTVYLLPIYSVAWENDLFTGSCAGGLQGLLCAVCPVGQSWAGEQCTECGAAIVIWVSAIAICLIAISASYFFVNDPVSWRGLRYQSFSQDFGGIS